MSRATPRASTHPWAVVRHPYGEPRYARDFNAAKKIIHKDLETLRRNFRFLHADDSIALLDGLIKVAENLDPWQRGSQWVEGLIDPVTGVRYRAELARREEF